MKLLDDMMVVPREASGRGPGVKGMAEPFVLPCSASKNYDLCCTEKDQEVELDGHVLDVEEIVLHFFLGFFDRSAVREHNLGPTRQPRFHGMAKRIVRIYLLQFSNKLRTFRTGAHKSQVSTKDII